MKGHLKEYLKLLEFVKPYRGVLILASLCMGAATLLEGVSFGMLGPLTDRVFTNKKIIIPGELPNFLTSIIEKFNSIEPQTFLKYIIVFLPLLFLTKGAVTYLQDYFMNVVGQGSVKDVKNRLYAKLQDLSMEFYAKKRTGELMSRITNDVAVIANALSYALKDLILESMKAAFFGFLAFYLGFKISWKLPLIAFIVLPSIMIPVGRLTKKIKKFTLEVQKKMADLNSLLAETIQGAYIVKAFSREKYELNRFKRINYNFYKFTLKSVKRMAVLSPLTEFIGVLGVLVILWFIGEGLISGKFSFGTFAAFLAFFMSMIRPFKKLSNAHAINQKALVASARIYEILEEELKVKEKLGAKDKKGFKQSIEFKGIWFKYNPEDDYVLKDINLNVKNSEVVALVGHSGAGKSTLVSLLPRFYDPQKGGIYLDQVNIKDYKLGALRSLISIVSQEMVLFNATVKDNIAYGKEGASESEIIEAAKKAHAFEFVSNFPEKFNTVIGDRGFRLSGGEKQRIAIARAILKDAPILILDEATSQLDSASEQLIKDALYTLMKGKTSFVIAHRLSTVQKADRIIVLENGAIIEEGTHSKLVSRDSLYKKLYDLQFNV